MKPELGGKGINPEAQSNPYSQIPDLVHNSILARPDRARRSQNELFLLVQGSEFFDPTIIAVANIQEEILNLTKKAKTPKDTARIKPALQLLHNVLMRGTGAGKNETNNLTLRLTQDVLRAVAQIEKNNPLFKTKKYLLSEFPEDIQNLENVIPVIESAHNNNQESLQIAIRPHHAQREELSEIDQFQKWTNSVRDLLDSRDDPKSQKKDRLIDFLKQEPNASFEGRERLYNRQYAGVSLRDMEQMDYPISPENFSKTTNFLISAFSDNSDNLYLDQDIISRLFLEKTLFYDISGPLPIKNKKLLANFNSWQEYYAYCILFETTIDRDLQISALLNKIPTTGNLAGVIYWSTNPLEMDPEREKPITETINHHPVLAEAYMEFAQNYSPEELKNIGTREKYIDEIGAEYLASTVITKLEKRLSALGVGDKFKGEVEKLKTFARETPYSKLHLDVIKQVFELHCGQEFLDNLEDNAQETKEITKSVWQDATDRMHFLPMESGENIIEFSQDSVPNLLGIKNISMIRVGSPQDWNINVSFSFENTTFELYNLLNKDGQLEFKAPIQQEIPGLYIMLNHIAVLTFHDLVVQEKKERESGAKKLMDGEKDRPTNGSKPKVEVPDKKRSGVLPRAQRDTSLISDVYEATGKVPRMVELHKRPLQRIRNYREAVDLYFQTVTTDNVSQDDIQAAQEIVDDARKRVYRISQQKRLNVPAKFRLETVQDPITGEEIYLETWVVEHSNPKPTPEELQSPVKLYQRYYKNSSALASLDQMKPWFIGQ